MESFVVGTSIFSVKHFSPCTFFQSENETLQSENETLQSEIETLQSENETLQSEIETFSVRE